MYIDRGYLQAEDIGIVVPLAVLPAAGLVIRVIAAWRWLLATVAVFVALVAINYAYVQWLEPLAEHH